MSSRALPVTFTLTSGQAGTPLISFILTAIEEAGCKERSLLPLLIRNQYERIGLIESEH